MDDDDKDNQVAARLSDAIAAALSEQAVRIGAISINAALGALVACIGKTLAAIPDRQLRRRFMASLVKDLPGVVEHARRRHVEAGLPDAPVVRKAH